jgi:protein-S-isoprenylcysteine O-methyltransferase Ste14
MILIAGLGLAVWARRHLGAYWSGYLVIREGHALIRNGPYTIVRHPIYAGIRLGVLGTAVAIGEWRALLAVALVLAAHVRKIVLEEDWLLQQFGEEYARYRREVRAIIPFVL